MNTRSWCHWTIFNWVTIWNANEWKLREQHRCDVCIFTQGKHYRYNYLFQIVVTNWFLSLMSCSIGFNFFFFPRLGGNVTSWPNNPELLKAIDNIFELKLPLEMANIDFNSDVNDFDAWFYDKTMSENIHNSNFLPQIQVYKEISQKIRQF